jgi:hypothetical protein
VQSKRERSYPACCQQHWEAGAGELWWSSILIAAPQQGFLYRKPDSRKEQGPRQTMPCGGPQTSSLENRSALMQCSLGSRSGTSGAELGGPGRSWAGDAVSLAGPGGRVSTGICTPHHTSRQSVFTARFSSTS